MTAGKDQLKVAQEYRDQVLTSLAVENGEPDSPFFNYLQYKMNFKEPGAQNPVIMHKHKSSLTHAPPGGAHSAQTNREQHMT